MEGEHADRRMRAYAALEGLRQSLPLAAQQHGSLQGMAMGHSIRLYETALDDLAACSENVEQYRLGKTPKGTEYTAMPIADLQARVMAVLGYFTIRDAVLSQASETGAALESLIGFETPQH